MPIGQIMRGTSAPDSAFGAKSNASITGASGVAVAKNVKASSGQNKPAVIDNVFGKRQANGIREFGIAPQQSVFLADSDRSSTIFRARVRREFEIQINRARELAGGMPQQTRTAKLLDLLYQQTGTSYNITEQLPKTAQHIPKGGKVPNTRLDISI